MALILHEKIQHAISILVSVKMCDRIGHKQKIFLQDGEIQYDQVRFVSVGMFPYRIGYFAKL